MNIEAKHWIFFNIFIVAMLALDLAVFHRKTHVVSIRESLLFTAGWVLLSLLFCLFIYYSAGRDTALEFLAAYVIEKSLSFDNIFVFILIFSFFNVPAAYQHKVLFWGIAGALAMRILFIFAGIAMIRRFHWVTYIFAMFLVITAIRMIIRMPKKIEPDRNVVVRMFKKYVPMVAEYRDDRFFVKEGGRLMATPLMIVLLVIEMSDIIFAVDSIPAILAVSNDLFIVYSSNVFAIMGLRSLFFALSGLYRHFRFLKYALSLILLFVGAKLALTDIYKIPVFAALLVIVAILVINIVLSVIFPRKTTPGQ
jgi:integral membrane protein, TerC family